MRRLESTDDNAEDSEPEIKRLGSANIVENMGIMLLFAFILFVVCMCILVIALVVRCNPTARSTYLKIKRKVFWNAFIRYVLQSTLKTQVSAGVVIALSLGITHHASEEGREEMSTTDLMIALAIPNTILLLLNICPLVFLCILKRNKNNLNDPECRAKYGQMYETIDVKHVKRPPSILGKV